jgi:hypothetical protein
MNPKNTLLPGCLALLFLMTLCHAQGHGHDHGRLKSLLNTPFW